MLKNPYQVHREILDGKRSGFGNVSYNFTWDEVFGSMQGNEWKEITQQMLVNAHMKAWWLQCIRDLYGPIKINSWLRPPSYNRRVGGAKLSSHIKGYAVDWVPLNYNMNSLYNQLLNSPFKGGIATKRGVFIHSDLRGVKVTWRY
jgi:uncharacterized protein YcbK (DUF882 family)